MRGTVPPVTHQALGYLTPNEFYAKWLREQASAALSVSDMS